MAVLADQLRGGRRLRSRRGGPVHGEDRVPDEAGRDDGPHQDPENQAYLFAGLPGSGRVSPWSVSSDCFLVVAGLGVGRQ